MGADKNYDTRDVVCELREQRVTPHVAQHTTGRARAIAGRTIRPPGYAASPRQRKGVAEICGWLKTMGLFSKTLYRGVARIGWLFTLAAAVDNLVRICTLGAVA